MQNQTSVWSKVGELQDALASHLRKQANVTGLSGVRSAASPTSLPLRQTSPPVEKAVSAYTKKLAGVVQGKRRSRVCICSQWRVEERGSIRLAGTFCLDVAEAAEIERCRGPTSGPSRKHRTCGYTPSHRILTRNWHWSRDNHPRGPEDSACEAGDCRPVKDGIERRFGLGASEHRNEVSWASVTACHLPSNEGLRASQPRRFQ
jgi:hypothetical protein